MFAPNTVILDILLTEDKLYSWNSKMLSDRTGVSFVESDRANFRNITLIEAEQVFANPAETETMSVCPKAILLKATPPCS